MKLLIDTHTLLWAVDATDRLSPAAAECLHDTDNDLLISAATIWELAIKVGQRKLKLSLPYRPWMDKAIADIELTILPVTVDYADKLRGLDNHHKDPFDRLIIAQSLTQGIAVVGSDAVFDAYGVTRIW